MSGGRLPKRIMFGNFALRAQGEENEEGRRNTKRVEQLRTERRPSILYSGELD